MLCGPKSSNICVIVFTEKEAKEGQLSPLKSVITQFENDPVSFAFVDT